MSMTSAVRSLCLLMLFLLLVAVSAPVSAQDDGMVPPTPDELEPGVTPETTDVVIESPAGGAHVETPFEVRGVAPAGATLELRIDGEMVRLFRANDQGQFTAAVTRARVEERGTITVAHVDSAGEVLSRDSVAVTRGAERQRKETQTEKTKETAAKKTPPPPDPVESKPKKKIRRPPPPEHEPEVRRTPAKPPPPRPVGRPLRIGGEALGGLAGGLTGFTLGASVGFLGGALFAQDPFAAIGFGVIAAFVGGVGGTGLGVWATGLALDGNGSILVTYLGTAVGTGLGILYLVGLESADPGMNESGVLLFPLFPLAGSIAGYELTSDDSADMVKYRKQYGGLSPHIGVSLERNTFTFGLHGSF